MAWYKTHEIAYSDTSTHGAARAYLFNTVLPAKGWTVTQGATSNEWFLQAGIIKGWGAGSAMTVGWYVSQTSATANSFSMLWDHVRDNTTIPNNSYGINSIAQDPEVYNFWYSTENDGVLATCGKQIFFYWPGSDTDFYLCGDDGDPTIAGTSLIFPWINYGFWTLGAPANASNSSITSLGWPMGTVANARMSTGRKSLRIQSPLLFAGSNTTTYAPVLKLNGSDVFLVATNNQGSASMAMDWRDQTGGTVRDGGTYYISSGPGDITRPQVWFDCGTTDPNF